jgi:hypothetical protein
VPGGDDGSWLAATESEPGGTIHPFPPPGSTR